jgi:ribosomal protein S18 acetylase RimI-like enzyme
MHIRMFRDADLATLKEITVEAFDGASIDQMIEGRFGLLNGGNWRGRKARHIDADVERDREGIFVADTDGEVLGYVTTWTDADAGIGHIPNIAVRAGHRGHGIGRLLIDHALGHFRRVGMTHVRIETLENNEVGNHLYTAMGFEEVTRQIHFIMALDRRKD